MDISTTFFARGMRFVRDNPQIIYTLFLVVAIPIAFFYTSEQFLTIARENQDALERSRAGLLTDVFVEFTGEHFDDRAYLEARMRSLAAQNETISRFDILEASGTDMVIRASLDSSRVGSAFTFLPEEEKTQALFNFVQAYPANALTDTYVTHGERIMRTVRGIPDPNAPVIHRFLLIDFSMAQGDAIALGKIRNAYILLFFIIFLIIVLLARQARIIDYTTLYQRLKEVDMMKDDFVAMAAHELRSPLTIIRGYTEMIGESEKLTPQGSAHLEHIDHAARELNTLIGDILDVAKLQEGRMSFQFANVDVSGIMKSIVDEFARPALDKGLTLVYEAAPLPLIAVDRDRFHQVMVNFIGNAIKYTLKGGVRVLTEVHDDRVYIRISDTGMGISADDQKKLFQKFFRVKNNETATITGTGLGLWITQEIVKTMKGTIAVESIKGKGTDFILSFAVVASH